MYAEVLVLFYDREAGEYGLTPFDALHAGLVTTGDGRVLSTEQDYDTVGLDRTPLEPDSSG
nr:hypothetical protein [Halorientalis sp. IM1011]